MIGRPECTLTLPPPCPTNRDHLTLRPELLDELLTDYEKPEDLLGEERLFKELKKALLERALGAELSDHLAYEKGCPAGRDTGNRRNGHSDKRVLTEDGEVNLAVPRDRNGTFDPVMVPKGGQFSCPVVCPRPS